MYCIQLSWLSLVCFKLEHLIFQSVYVFHDLDIFKGYCPAILSPLTDLPDASSLLDSDYTLPVK